MKFGFRHLKYEATLVDLTQWEPGRCKHKRRRKKMQKQDHVFTTGGGKSHKWKSNIGLKNKKQSGEKTWRLVTSALLRRAFVPLVPHRLNIRPRVPLSQKYQPLTEEWSKKKKRMCRRRNKKRKDKSASDVAPWEEKQGEKRMDCEHCDCARGIFKKAGLKRGALKCVHKQCGMCCWWVDLRLITSTLSWTVMQLAASFWRISVTPLASRSYFSFGSSSLSSSWFGRWIFFWKLPSPNETSHNPNALYMLINNYPISTGANT